MTIHIKLTDEERTAYLKTMWDKPLTHCGGRNQPCPFSVLINVGHDLHPKVHCILPRCEPNRQAVISRKTHKSSFRGKRVKKFYPLLGVYHATYRRKKVAHG